MSAVEVDPSRLDDVEALAAADSGELLRKVASAAAHVREAQLLTSEARVGRITDGGRPRAIVVVGMGGAGLTGEVLAAVCGPGCRVPITTVRGYRLPGWVGAADLVMAVSCSGTTAETLAVAAEAVRRGCRLLCVGAGGSPLADIAVQSGALFVPVPPALRRRTALWGLLVPLLVAVDALGLADVPPAVLESAAGHLEEASHQCRPASESFVNPGKQTALEIAGSIPVIWGSSPLTGVVARRFAAQLAEYARYPAVHGELPGASHDQLVLLDGAFGGASADDNIFRDRVDEPEPTRLRLVLVADRDDDPRAVRRREVCVEYARERGVPVTELIAEDGHPLERLAPLVAHVDYAAVYLALATGVDPSAAPLVEEIEARTQ